MAISREINLYILLCCVLGDVSHAGLIDPPLNVAATLGSTVRLQCRVANFPPQSRIMWGEFITNPSGRSISDNYNILDHPNRDRYQIYSESADQFDLEIRDVGYQDGGRYVCQDTFSGPPTVYRGEAELIVMESDPRCKDFSSNGVVVEGASYSSECEVRYRGNIAPVMDWKGPSEFLTNGSTTPDIVWTWNRFTAEKDMKGEVFQCHTKFPYIIAAPGHASNTPTYTHTYTSPVIRVRRGPHQMDVSPRKSFYIVGDVITCTADSNPTATYVWTNMRTLVSELHGPTFTVTEALAGFDQTMRCHAEVTIEGSLYSNDIFINVSVPGQDI